MGGASSSRSTSRRTGRASALWGAQSGDEVRRVLGWVCLEGTGLAAEQGPGGDYETACGGTGDCVVLRLGAAGESWSSIATHEMGQFRGWARPVQLTGRDSHRSGKRGVRGGHL